MIRRLLSACAGVVFAVTLAAPAAAQPTSPKDEGVTCPYLRQQMTDRHACQNADPQMGREVIDNLRLLKQADGLLQLAKDLAQDGFLLEAMECCDCAAKLCPGSPCAARAVNTLRDLALGIDAEQMPNSFGIMGQLSPVSDRNFIEQYYKRPWDLDPNFDTFLFIKQHQSNQVPPAASRPHDQEPEAGGEQLVASMIDSCYILMSRGMHHEAAKLARQAYARDPQRVLADPLIYKMHLLAEVPATQPAGANEASEAPACPYCPSSGKPIREIVPEKKPSAIDYEFEVNANTSGLRLCADCSMNGNVYHVRFKNGCLTIWKTADAGKTEH